MALTRPKYSSIEDTDYKASCRVVTTTNITLAGGAPSVHDSINLAAGDRVLVTGQSSPTQNGIYVVQTLGTGSNGTWIRSKDANTDAKVTAGFNTYIEEGTYAAQQWRLATANPITLGVTELTFIAPSGGTVGGNSTNIQYNANGAMAGATNFRYWAANGNVTIGSTTASTNADTGALVVKGGAAVAGNVYADALRTTTGIYWSGNGNPIAGITYTASSSAPSGPTKGDQWYNTSNDVLYEYVFDGTSSYWVDIQTSIIAANAIPSSTLTNSGYTLSLESNGALISPGTIHVNNRIDWVGTTYAPPSFTTRSIGQKITLYPAISGSAVDYALGINGGVLWSTIPTATAAHSFKWYGGETELASLFGTGNLTVISANITGTNASASNTTGALVVGGGVGITGNINLVYNPTSGTGYALGLTGKDTQGGTGYFDFLKITNTTSGVANGAKSFRLTSGGGIEIINNAYTLTLLSLSDAGDLNIKNSISVNGSQAVNGPAFSAYANATLQTITSGGQQKVLFQTEEFDTNNNFASSRFTPTVAGYYQLNAQVRLDGATGTGEIMIILYKNGSEYKRGTNQQGTQIAANFWAMTVSSLAYANGTGDYFEIYVQQTSGSSVTVTAVNNTAITWFNGAMVRGA